MGTTTSTSTGGACPFHDAAGQPAAAPNGCPISDRARAFDPFDGHYMRDPAAYLAWAREEEPVFYSPTLGYWIVTRYEDVKAVFRDNLLFSPSVALEKITPAGPGVRAVLQRYGNYTELAWEDCGHGPHLDKAAEFDAALEQAKASGMVAQALQR